MAGRYWISWTLFFIGGGVIALLLVKGGSPESWIARLLVFAFITVPIAIWALRRNAQMGEQIIPSKGIEK